MILFIDLIDDKRSGIFALLNNETKLKLPSVSNFTLNVHSAWKSSNVLALSRDKKTEEGFTIQHFANKVSYNTVDEFCFVYIHGYLYSIKCLSFNL